MEELSDRQTKILKAIIEEYIENGEAVGSEVLEKNMSWVFRRLRLGTKWLN